MRVAGRRAARAGRTDGAAGVDSARAWKSVVAGFLSMFATFGVAYSFGVFFEPMSAELETGRGATALVFSLTAFLYFTLGLFSGQAVDRVGPRKVLLFGAAVMGVGLLLTSRVNSIGLGYLTYGIGVGVGAACGYVPMLAVVGGWFQRKRSTALGVAVAGIGLGTLIVAPLADRLIDAYGWRTTYVIFAVAATAMLVVAAALAERPPVQSGAAPLRLGRQVRTPAFVSLYVSALLLSLALFLPFVYIVDFATGEGVSAGAAAALVGVVGAASIVGRLLLGPVADRFGRTRTYRLCFLVMGLSYGIWLVASSFGPLLVFTVVMGVAYGGFIALAPAVVADKFGVAGVGGVIGAVYTSAGLGALLGPPLAGLLIDATGTYRWAIALAMVMGVAGYVALLPLDRLRTEPA